MWGFVLGLSFLVLFLVFFSCTDPENIVRGGPTLIMFLVDDNGLTSTQQLNAITMVFRWLADSGQTLNAGLVAL